MRTVVTAALCGASYLCLSAAAQAQVVENPGATTEELLIDPDEDDFVTDRPFVEESDAVDAIIVTARRREESVQEVPLVVNTVSAEDIAQLNLREFAEIEGLVPGLSFQQESFGSGGASIRGVAFDVSVSGSNPTVEFYLNDTPVTGGVVLRQMYDISQIEVLRGPQGTLRGRASPSGSITVTTRKPDLDEVGGYVSMTGTHLGGINVNGGIGVPLIEGVLAVRAAGLYNIEEGSQLETIGLELDTGELGQGADLRDPYSRTQSGRISALFEPTEWLQFEGMYQRLESTSRFFQQVESAEIVDPDLPAGVLPSPIFIDAEDQLAIQGFAGRNRSKLDTYTWKAMASFANQNLIYTGGYREQRSFSRTNADALNLFPEIPFGQITDLSRSFDEAHELRLQNEEIIGGFLDYVVGVFRQEGNSPTDLVSQTLIALPPDRGGPFIVNTPIQRLADRTENSVFGNVTLHLGDALEVSGGLRYIDYEDFGDLLIGGNSRGQNVTDEDKLIYTASINYFLNPDVMLYANTGTSFRPGPTVIGDFSVQKSALQESFTSLPPEDSVSYEVGLKSTLMNGDLRFNISGFYQDFENYPFRGSPVFYQTFTNVGGTVRPGVGSFAFIAAVPVEIYGVEAEIGYEITRNWDISAVAAYTQSEIKEGLVPCNDLDGDGVPDVLTARPTLTQIQLAYPEDFLGACRLTQDAGFTAPFIASVQSEYDRAITPMIEGFARGLFSYFGESDNDPQNPVDDVDAYGILNLYAGLRDPEGMWELALYGKNVFDVTRVLDRSDTLLTTSFRNASFAQTTIEGPYRAISTTAPREFGLNLRVAFGSR